MNILIIDDSPTLAHMMEMLFAREGFQSKSLDSGSYDPIYPKNGSFDIYITNLELKNIDPIQILKDVRRLDKDGFIVAITRNGNWKKKVEFLNEGGDDVINYPFATEELISRLKSLRRRPKTYRGEQLHFKDYIVDTNNKEVSKGDNEIPLRKKEFQVLEYLVRNSGRVVTRDELFDHVWDYRRVSSSNTVDVHIKRIRDKLMDNDAIKTVHGFGYTVEKEDSSKASSALSNEYMNHPL